MNDTWVGLWAAGLLTRAQRTRLVGLGLSDEASVLQLWESEQRRSSKWAKYATAQELLDEGARAYARLRGYIDASPSEVSLSLAEEWGVRSSSPYLCWCGARPPREGVLGVVGTRGISQLEAERLASWLEPLVAQAQAIVSGGALGVDTVAHRTALSMGIPTWVVFASGLQQKSPKVNDQMFEECLAMGGGWLSEKPPWYSPRAHDFLERNEVIAALSHAVLVARAPYRSGALSTARAAQSQGKAVLAFSGEPDDPNAEGCHQLIQRGAILATPKLRLDPWLGPNVQLPLLAASGERLSVGDVAPLCWTDDERAMLSAFFAWQEAGASGWMANSASRHQELLLDLELGGWLERDAAGNPQWTEKGRRAEKSLLRTAALNASC